MRNPSQVLLLAVLMVSLILPPGLPVAGAAKVDPAAPAVKRILLVGDSLSIGLGKQLETAFAGQASARFAYLGKVSSGLANPAFFDWEAQLAAQVASHHPDVVLIMLGANDDKPLPTGQGRTAAFGTKAWEGQYAKRIARLHGIARSLNPSAAVYLVGVPVMGDATFNASMDRVNAVLAGTAASLPDCSYIDVRDVLADARGAYAPVAKAPSGAVVKLRADDGVHISGAGSRLLAARLIETIAVPAGLSQGALLASIDNRDLTPVARAGQSPVRVAELGRPAVPTLAPASLALAGPAIAQIAVQDQPRPAPAAVAAAPKTTALPAASPVAPASPARPQAVAAKPAPSAVAPALSGPAYTVADGDTVWSVAKRLGLSPDALVAANPGLDPRRLSIGQRLAAPAGIDALVVAQAMQRPAGPSTPAASVPRAHTVAEGDNFWSVARQHGVTVAALTQANPGVDPTRLRIGQGLALPVTSQAAARPAVSGKPHAEAAAPAAAGYVVADGDNFWTIARRLGVDASDLTRLNAGLDPLHLKPGQVLAVPENARAEALRAPAAPAAGEARAVSDAGLYPVAPGDTLWALSRRFGVSLEAMLALNGEVDPVRLKVGQLVTVPADGSVVTSELLIFPVSAGDSLWSIARRFDISVEALAAANPGVDPLHLREGQTLRVPSSLAAVAASGAPKKEAVPAPAAAVPAPAEAQSAPVGPAAGPVNTPARQHVISEGETVWNLARTYGLSAQRILAENAGLDPVRLQVGQVLRLPGGTVSMAAR